MLYKSYCAPEMCSHVYIQQVAHKVCWICHCTSSNLHITEYSVTFSVMLSQYRFNQFHPTSKSQARIPAVQRSHLYFAIQVWCFWVHSYVCLFLIMSTSVYIWSSWARGDCITQQTCSTGFPVSVPFPAISLCLSPSLALFFCLSYFSETGWPTLCNLCKTEWVWIKGCLLGTFLKHFLLIYN